MIAIILLLGCLLASTALAEKPDTGMVCDDVSDCLVTQAQIDLGQEAKCIQGYCAIRSRSANANICSQKEQCQETVCGNQDTVSCRIPARNTTGKCSYSPSTCSQLAAVFDPEDTLSDVAADVLPLDGSNEYYLDYFLDYKAVAHRFVPNKSGKLMLSVSRGDVMCGSGDPVTYVVEKGSEQNVLVGQADDGIGSCGSLINDVQVTADLEYVVLIREFSDLSVGWSYVLSIRTPTGVKVDFLD